MREHIGKSLSQRVPVAEIADIIEHAFDVAFDRLRILGFRIRDPFEEIADLVVALGGRQVQAAVVPGFVGDERRLDSGIAAVRRREPAGIGRGAGARMLRRIPIAGGGGLCDARQR
ncbi:MAG: hypothetical protein ACREFL_12110 [Stellaceae bacterium]